MTETLDLADFNSWIHWQAGQMLGGYDHPNHEDLVSEGRIAMWLAHQSYDQSRGSLVSWVTTKAKWKMKSIAWGRGQWTGHEDCRGGRGGHGDPRKGGTQHILVDDFTIGHLEPVEEDAAEWAMWAYHRGEIHAAIDRLPPAQKAAVFQFLDPARSEGLDNAERQNWLRAKRKLAEELEHLKEM